VFKRRQFPDPGTKIYEVIRYFGTRNKVLNVHFRNIRKAQE
jgi:mannonate dehydratase